MAKITNPLTANQHQEITAALPDMITLVLKSRTYHVPRIIAEGEVIRGKEILDRTKKANATLGEEDGEWFIENQDDIPIELRGKVVFVFTEWRDRNDSRKIHLVIWSNGRWTAYWRWLGNDWYSHNRPVERIA